MLDIAPGLTVAFAAYLLGGIPVGLIVARRVAGIDVREHGSSNIGATNVYRVVGARAGALVWVLDVLKGVAPTIGAAHLGLHTGWCVLAGLAAVVGHSFSPFLRFRGGKGAATSFGVMLGVMWPVAACNVVLWLGLVAITRYVSVATIVSAAAMTPLTLVLFSGDTPRLVLAILAGTLTILRHRSNIQRLLNGTEHRFGQR